MACTSDITLVLPTLCRGGAEKVMCAMADWWCAQGKRVELITFDDAPSPFPLDARVKRLALDDLPDLAQPCPEWPEESLAVARLRHALSAGGTGPVISFMAKMNIRTLLAARGLSRRVIVSDRCHPPLYPYPEQITRLRARLYPEASRVVMQTMRSAREWAYRFLPEARVAVIPNAVLPSKKSCSPNATSDAAPRLPERGFLLAAGRLDKAKGFDLLLKAFAAKAKILPELRLIIAGEGLERQELETLRERLGLTGRVFLPGARDDLPKLMAQARAFVLSSRYEGFPNVLLEALAAGLPVVAFDCPAGPRECITHEHNGLLVPAQDTALLGEALWRIATDEALHGKLAGNAKDVFTNYSMDSVMAQWNALLAP